MTEIISHPTPVEGGTRTARRDWPLITGVAASLVALSYLAAALHERYVMAGTNPAGSSHSAWFPLQLFVIAVSPPLAGFIFLWSERHLQNKATQKFLRNVGMFGFGMVLAAWVAMVAK